MSKLNYSISHSHREWLKAFFAAAVSFLTYASVYAYRKPFTVATFEGISFWGVPYQTLLVISQVIGYMLSKFSGIRFISELRKVGRWKTSLILIVIAWLSLLILAIVPPPFGIFCLMLNGYMLGFMWGIIFSYVEGRRTTDMIGAAMAVSFIFAGGFTRSVALWIRDYWHITDPWIGFVTGLLFIVPLLVFLYLMEQIPLPTERDIAERTVRIPMDGAARKKILVDFGAGLLFILITYVLLTIMRDVRDNFMANMWIELGYGKKPAIFTQTETITSILVLLIMGMLVFIRNNQKAFQIIHIVIVTGFVIAGASSFSFIKGWIGGVWWMQLTGLGLYMGYIPFNCVFFERFIATFRIIGNVGFLIYVADAYGYLGSVAVLLVKELTSVQWNWVSFYAHGVILFAVIGIAGTFFSLLYFKRKHKSIIYE
jgi:MFS family permease